MKTMVLIVLTLFCCLAGKGQMDHHFGPLDPGPLRIPTELTYSTQHLAGFIQQQYSNDRARVAAAYTWVTANIRYSKDSMLSINWSKNREDKITATLRRRKGVCDNFASVFADIIAKMAIPSYVVNGVAKGNIEGQAHSWTALKLDGHWYMCDPTWDAGPGKTDKNFLITPTEFIATHWPFDPLWQLLPNPISLREFDSGYRPTRNPAIHQHVEDSVQTFLALDSLQQLQAQGRRMRSIGLEQNTFRTWYAYNNMNIAIIHGEQDMNLFNAAVADLNKANNYLNSFIQYRNNFFKPALADRELPPMLEPIDGLVKDALSKIDQIGKGRENFQYDTGTLRDRILSLQKRVQEQRQFLTLYLNGNANERERFFYQ